MSTAEANCAPFNGLNGQSIDAWLANYEWIVWCLEWSEETKYENFPLYLDGPAKRWYETVSSLPGFEYYPSTWDKLKPFLIASLTDYRVDTHSSQFVDETIIEKLETRILILDDKTNGLTALLNYFIKKVNDGTFVDDLASTLLAERSGHEDNPVNHYLRNANRL